MRRIIPLMLCAALLTGCTASAETRTGEAQGYGGPLTVSVTMNGTDITAVSVTSHSETDGVGTRAIDVLPDMIVRADSVNVDSVSGATMTSNAIKEAVSRAIGNEDYMAETIPSPDPAVAMDATSSLRTGVGMASTGRVLDMGEDSDPVYALNVAFASASFDAQGRIAAVRVDQLEVFTPQIGDGASVFSGFPGQGDVSAEDFLAQIPTWSTKGVMGNDYMLQSGSWRQQMDVYERQLVGMTMDEVDAWYARLFDPETGRPLTQGEDYNALSDADKALLAEVTSSATISLRGEYGDILLALHRAWEDAQRTGSTQQTVPGGPMVDTNTTTDALDGESTMG